MNLFFCEVEAGNFGDDMNRWFWDEVFPDFRTIAPGVTMFGIGSLLWDENFAGHDRILVMGSGAGVGRLPDFPLDHVEFGFVRGPHTAKAFDLPEDRGISDPACLVPRLERFADDGPKSDEVLFIPHTGTMGLELDWQRICDATGITLLSPRGDSEQVISRIAGASRVITESLHGAIVADAFRVPWSPIAISPMFSSFKWNDWAASLEMDLTIPSALRLPKRTYGIFSSVRKTIRAARARVRKAPKVRIAGENERSPLEQYHMSQGERGFARTIMRRASSLIEPMLISDLRHVLSMPPMLSDDAILANRQDRMLEKFEAIGEDLDIESFAQKDKGRLAHPL